MIGEIRRCERSDEGDLRRFARGQVGGGQQRGGQVSGRSAPGAAAPAAACGLHRGGDPEGAALPRMAGP